MNPPSVPKALTLGYYEPARDYQGGAQRVQRAGPGIRETRIELPAALGAGVAKQLAAEAMAKAQCERERRTVTLGLGALPIRPGERVRIDGVEGLWRVDRWSLEHMVVKLECVRVAGAALAVPASGGRSLAADDLIAGKTVLALLELPPLDEAAATVPQLYVAAAGTGPGWRSAALVASTDGGTRWSPAGSTAYPATLGTVAVPPGAASAALFDLFNRCEVELVQADLALQDADDAALLAGANLAMLGEELIQFGHAERLSATRWRLGRLLRGRRGTEAAIGTQQAGDRFVLIAQETLATLPLALTIASTVRVLAQGASNAAEAVSAERVVRGTALVPPAPVHLHARREGGTTTLHWIRRSRTGWAWRDGIDAPLAEEGERYVVTLDSAAGTRTVEVSATELLLSAKDRAAALAIEVRQIGTFGLSLPARLALAPLGDTV